MSDRPLDPPEGGEPLLPSDWQELAPLIDAVLDAAPEDRARRILELCGGNTAREHALTLMVAECELDTPLLEGVAAVRFGGLAHEPEASLLPELLGDRYRTGRELGHGGMARVYLARDLKHGRDVAIKVIRPELSASLGHDRFLREIEIAARLRHPNIVPVYDSGEAGSALYFVMPYEEGPSLRERLVEEGTLPITDALNLLRDVARALAYAHEHGVVHRDVKPDNVMLSGGAAVVTDFGIAKAVSVALSDVSGPTLTQSGSALGTPAYMAPEQATGDPATDHRADIYSFGCVAYELLTGKPPFHDQAVHQLIAAHISTVPSLVSSLRADIPPALARLVAHCLEKNPGDRPQSARELLSALESAAVTGTPAPPIARTGRRTARALWWTGAAVAAAAIATVAWLTTRKPGASAPITIAVLPFGNIGGDSTIEYVADVLPEEVAGALQRVPGIQIQGRSGARAYRGVLGVDVAEAAAKFKADYVMTGEVRQEGGRWIVSVDLERAADLTSLWGETFDVRQDQVTGAADAIAGSLTRALKNRFPAAIGATRVLGAGQRTSNSEAYGLYMRGQDKLNRRGKSVQESVELFRKAIHADTAYARAYAGLSMALALYPYFQGVPPKEIHDVVVSAAQRALELDPTLALPHVALGLVEQYAFKWDAAATEFRTAIDLDPHDVEARVQYSRHLLFRGRLPEAIYQLDLARAEDPASAVVLSHTSYYYYLNHQMDSALADSRWALENDSNNVTSLGLGSLVQLGNNNFKEARRLADRAPPSFLANEYVLAKSGDSATARLRLLAQEARISRPWMAETRRGMTYIALGDTARALTAMELATDRAEIWPLVLGAGSPVYDPIRSSTRFQALLRRVGLAP